MLSVMRPLTRYLHGKHMEPLGLRLTMRLAKSFNRWRDRRYQNHRLNQFEEHFDALVQENGQPAGVPMRFTDGFALDASGKLPHLDQLCAEGEEIIQERALVQKKSGGQSRTFFQNILNQEDLERYPSILNFALSSDVLIPICRYLRTIPILSTTLPPGVRLAESSVQFDPTPSVLRESQLYHLDHHDMPMAYVIVLLRDVTADSGPFSFLSLSASETAARALNYRSKQQPYRVTDQRMYEIVDRKELQELIYPKGTILYIDSSRCFHYGSRNAVIPRYMMMYAFTSVSRTDLTESFLPPYRYPWQDSDSRLRKMVLNKRYVD